MSPRAARRVRRPPLLIEALETRQVLSTMLGLTGVDTLINFDSQRPDVIRSNTAIVGLQTGETILAIDSRAATGQVYGLGSSGRIYTLNPNSGAASLVGNGPIGTTLSGTNFNIDFDAGSSNLRITSDSGEDLRIDVDSGILTVDPNLAYAPTDIGAGTTAHIIAAAYSNNRPDAISGTLFEIDAARNAIVTQEIGFNANGIEQSTGQLHTFASLGLAVQGSAGLEVTPEGSTFLLRSGPSSSLLYAFSSSGSQSPLSLIGSFPSTISVRDIASLPAPRPVFAVTASNTLISFNSATPSTLLSSHGILGLQPAESVAAIAFRPSTGVLYGFGTTGRLYTINVATGSASAVSLLPISPPYDGSKPSIDFLASVDRLRLVTKAGENFRINPDLGVVDEVDNPLTYASGDIASGFPPAVVAEAQAYTGTVSKLFGIDSARDTFITQDTAPLSGTLTTIGPLGLAVTDDVGLDSGAFSSGTTITLASLTEPGAMSSTLYRLNPRADSSSSVISLISLGPIGGGSIIRDLAIAPAGIIGFSSPKFAVSEAAGSATITVVRTAGNSGPIQVQYVSSGGSAMPGIDYTPVNGVLNFASGETIQTFTVPIRIGAFAAGSRTVNFTLYTEPGVASGSMSATLTIVAPLPTLTPGIASTIFNGTVTAITSVDVTFNGPVDSSIAVNLSTYVIAGVTSDRSARAVTIGLASTSYDPLTLTTHLTLLSPITLSNFRAIQVIARGFGIGGSDSAIGYFVQRGSTVNFSDADGDRVILQVTGRGAKLDVLRRIDGGAVTVWVEGSAKLVTGSVKARRGSNHSTTIDRIIAGRARLKLARSITVRTIA